LEVILCALLTADDFREIDSLVTKVEARQVKDSSDSMALDVAALLRRRAFNALDTTKQLEVARKLYEQAKRVHSKDHDSAMMLWLLDKVSLKEGACLPGLEEFEKEISLDLGAVEYVLLSLIEQELWNDLSELCEWGLGIVNKGRDEIWCRRCAQIMKVATTLAELMQLCYTLLEAEAQNHYTEEVARVSVRISQLFEEFLCLLVGGDVEGSSSATEEYRKLPLNPSVRTVPLISLLTNSRVLTNLASLIAGWLQRCQTAGLIPWQLALERYGALATVTSGASFASGFTLRVAPEFGRNLFSVLLERIVELPGVVERDKEKGGHRWLQGLADLAFEDEAYLKALQLYLLAGGIKSAFYCDRSSAMPEEVFTPWVLRRMVSGCKAIGATVQAALLCQKLPGPDHESAFRILQENSLIVVRDAVAYFDCVWEVPLLELLVHMHAKSGDHERQSALISLLQQPALNAHNPQSVRVAHVASLEQRFLQRLCGELL
jgi:integrator complex subunit 8